MNTAKAKLKRSTLSSCLLAFMVIPIAGFPQTTEDPAALVNPFVGTGTSSLHDNAYTTPGAVRPFGLLYWSPDTPDIVNYHYEHPVIYGFSLTHISGSGCGLFGDVPIFPMLGAPVKSPSAAPGAYEVGFNHSGERAEPGYYEVRLDSGIEVRLAVQMRSGIAEFRFPPGKASRTLLIDLGRNLTPKVNQAEIQIRNRTVTGSVSSGEFCGFLHNHYRVYFALETDQAPEAYGTFDETGLVAGSHAAGGPHAGGYLSFGSSVRTVRAKVGISFVSAVNAEANLRSEIGSWDLDGVRRDARVAWNNALGRVRVSGGTDEDRKVFYTALYHSLLHPSVFSDVNGEYIGFDGKAHTTGGRTQYANFSGWDIYRSQVQLLAMLFPEVASDMAQSLVVDAEQGGGLPIWVAANDDCGAMVGDPSACILASMYAFGARGFDVKAALTAMLRGANDPRAHSRQYLERPDLEDYLRLGYVVERAESGHGAASVTLEYENADFAISRLAAVLGDLTSARALFARSAQWRKLFDPETRYIRPRGADGSFLSGFTPANETGFVEGNSAQYTWMIPYDLAAVIAAVGGPEEARERLDSYFSQYYDVAKDRGPYFWIGNEPSFGDPWIYNWSGHPWRTQEVVRKTLRDLFSAQPGGLPGNDDLGATPSWAVFAQLGLYPEIPGVGGVTLNSPMFPEITLQLGQRVVRITAAGAPSKLYVQSVRLDGEPLRNWWIDWERLSKASGLDFTLSAEPNHDPGLPPPSFGPTER
jgi:predicted alpha-1,2-mannosidase